MGRKKEGREERRKVTGWGREEKEEKGRKKNAKSGGSKKNR